MRAPGRCRNALILSSFRGGTEPVRLSSFFSLFRRDRFKSDKAKSARGRSWRRTCPYVEALEDRVLMTNDIPAILGTGVFPLDGSTTNSTLPPLQVRFSEPMSISAEVPSNYVLTNSFGDLIPINAVTLD